MIHGRNILDVEIIDHNNIVLVGGYESNSPMQCSFNTSTGGLDWNIVVETSPPWLTSVAFDDSQNGIAVGYAGAIMRSRNAGNSFLNLTSPLNRQFSKIIRKAPHTYFVCGGRNTDTLQTIISSSDSGSSWNVLRDCHGKWLRSIGFADALNGFAVGDSGTILATADGGTTWNQIASPIARDFKDIAFVTPLKGFIVGGDMASDTICTILQTINGGLTWSVLLDETGGILTSIDFASQTTGYICGHQATLLKSLDAGLTWNPITIPGSFPSQEFTTVDFPDTSYGMVGTMWGNVYIYSHTPSPEAYTLGSYMNDTTTATFLAGINTHGHHGEYIFTYSPDSNFTTAYTTYYPGYAYNNFLDLFQYYGISWLIPDTTYYYYVTAYTLGGYVRGNTLSFYTGHPFTDLQTLAATNTTNTSGQINGTISHCNASMQLFFEYGSTPLLGTEIAASPPLVNDTATHFMSRTITGLQTYTKYYFRLKGLASNKTYYGNILSFITGSAIQQIQSYPATNITVNTADLNGIIEGAHVPVNLSFEYGITPSLGTEIPANPSSVNDTVLHAITLHLSNLTPYTIYYYRLKAVTSVGTFSGNTLSFTSGTAIRQIQTDGATNINASSADLNGFIDGANVAVDLSFEYGTTPSFGNQTPANPSSVNDTLPHNLMLHLSNLNPLTTYYYRLKAVTAGGIFYGQTVSFFTGTIFTEIQTMAATVISADGADLNGSVNGFRTSASLSFEYGTSPSFGNQIPANPSFVNDSSSHIISVHLNNLQPSTLYYFRLIAVTSYGTFYGNTLTFNTLSTSPVITTLTAMAVDNSSARLKGRVSDCYYPSTAFFQYGLTPALGMETAAIPYNISDTAVHIVSLPLSGLLTNSFYYYRVKIFNQGGIFYGNTRKVFVGVNTIPNWDFENWTDTSGILPNSWKVLGGLVDRVPGHSGNYAMKISGRNIAAMGFIGDNPPFFPGSAFNYRPDSVTMFLNYNIFPDDSALVIVILFNNGQIISQQFFPIGGNSNNAFRRFSFPLHYNSPLTPDSLFMAFGSTNFNDMIDSHAFDNNYLTVDDISFGQLAPVIPNGDFENWFDCSLHMLDQWDYPHFYLAESYPQANPFVFEEHYGTPPESAVEVRSIPFVHGLVFGCDLSLGEPFTASKPPVFAVAGSHDCLTGYVKFFPEGGDTLNIYGDLYYHHQNVGSIFIMFPDSITEFTPFEGKVTYYDISHEPDSAALTTRIYNHNRSNLHAGSWFALDKLRFDGYVCDSVCTPSGIHEYGPGQKYSILMYPNPANDHITVEFDKPVTGGSQITLMDLNGRIIREIKIPNTDKVIIDVSDMEMGMYFIRVKSGRNTAVNKIIVIK